MSLSKIASFDDNEKSFNIHDVEIPTLNEGEILVRIIYTTICRSDLYTFEGKRKEKSPTILGHEIVGRVVSFGNDVNQLDIRGALMKKDDRITWGIYASNPSSIYSKRGIPQKAEDLFKYGHEQITNGNTLHGGLAEYIILRKNTPVIKISDELSDEVSALINCSVATVAAAIRMAGDVAGKNIVVCGVGMLGTIACAMASWMGAKNILSIDNNIDRLNKSKEFGSTNTVLNSDSTVELKKNIQQSISEKFNIDIVLEFSGVPSAVEATLGLLDIGGTAVWVGSTFTQPSISVNAEQIVRRLITIKGIHNYNQDDLLSAVEFMEQSHTKFNFQSLIKGGFKLEDTQAAFEYALKENPFRVGIQIS
jgi:alcohol dehydrogenase